jgi:DNA-binding transcriptional LysR family regulator
MATTHAPELLIILGAHATQEQVDDVVARLEEDLGAQLLARSTRRMALNDDGREFYARCQQILNDIEDAEASVKSAGEAPKGRLRMALPVLFGRLTLLPRIAEFTERYPEIVLDLSFVARQLHEGSGPLGTWAHHVRGAATGLIGNSLGGIAVVDRPVEAGRQHHRAEADSRHRQLAQSSGLHRSAYPPHP